MSQRTRTRVVCVAHGSLPLDTYASSEIFKPEPAHREDSRKCEVLLHVKKY